MDFGTVDSAQNVTLIATATDSRGLSTTVKKTVYMIAYSQPYATVTLVRVNNYEDTSKLTVDGSIASVNGKNAMTIKYRYKQSGGAYGDFTEIQNDAEQLFFLNKNYSFIFEVQITDLLGGNFVKEYVLDKGKFPLFIDTAKNAVGINEFPSKDEALRVKGGAGNFEDGIKIASLPIAEFIVEQGISDIWEYRKWANGKIELWTTNQIGINAPKIENNLGLSDDYQWNFPNGILAQALGAIASTDGNLCWVGRTKATASYLAFRIFRTSPLTDGTKCNVSAYVFGTWK